MKDYNRKRKFAENSNQGRSRRSFSNSRLSRGRISEDSSRRRHTRFIRENTLNEYEVVVNWNSFIGCEQTYGPIVAANEEEAIETALMQATEDFESTYIDQVDDEEYEVGVQWGGIGCEQTYTVYESDESSAEEQAFLEASWDLEAEEVNLY